MKTLLGKDFKYHESYDLPTEVVLSVVSETKIECVCDRCGKDFTLSAANIRKRKDGFSLCKACALSEHTKRLNEYQGKERTEKAKAAKALNPLKYRKIALKNLPKALVGDANPNWKEKTFEYVESKKEYKKYILEVYKWTERNELNKLPNFSKRGRAGVSGAFHVDHKYSIKQGYLNKISPKILGDFSNLEMLSWEDNIKKNKSSSLTLGELFAMIEMKAMVN